MIDTFIVVYKASNYNHDYILSLPSALKKLSTADLKGNFRLCIKPSHFFKSHNKVLCTLEEALIVKTFFDKEIGETGELKRIDFAYDVHDTFAEIKKLNKFFISLISVANKLPLDKVFSTSTHKASLNTKIKNKTMEYTIYNFDDKPNRPGNTRYEKRFMSFRNSDDFKTKVLKSLNSYNEELYNLINFIPDVETYFSELIYIEYQSSKNKYKNLHEFIAKMDTSNLILTKNVFKQFFEKVSDGNVDFYIKNFRRKRKYALKFITKLELETLIKKIRIAIDKTK